MAASPYNYVVTAQRPTSVTQAITGHFTGPEEHNLIIAKATRIEVYLLTADGLVAQFDAGIYGRIEVMELIRPTGEAQDLLFVCTEDFSFFVLRFNSENNQLETFANGNLEDRIGRQTDVGILGDIAPSSDLAGLQFYDGLLKILPLSPLGEAYNVSLEELQVLDFKFLYGYAAPTICILYQDPREARHVKTYELSVESKMIVEGPWKQPNVEGGATKLHAVPSPRGGVLIFGMESITYHSGERYVSLALATMGFTAVGQVDEDGSRYLLGDDQGSMYVLALRSAEVGGSSDQSQVEALDISRLGSTSTPSALAYLDSGVVFVGSEYGDSQLVKLLDTPIGTNTGDEGEDSEEEEEIVGNGLIQELDRFTNLGPIVDLCVVDVDVMGHGQGQVVTCSGVGKDGSLRVVRNGIGINEVAEVELPGIKGMWRLCDSSDAQHDSYLVQAFRGETRVLGMEDEEMGELEPPGIDADAQTLWAGNVVGDRAVQVTTSAVRLLRASDLDLLQEWKPTIEGSEAAPSLTVAAGCSSQIVVAAGGGILVYLEVGEEGLVEVARQQMEHDIACLDLTPIPSSALLPDKDEDEEDGAPAAAAAAEAKGEGEAADSVMGEAGSTAAETSDRASMVAVGLWTDITVRLLRLPSLTEAAKEALGGDTLPRSLLLTQFDNRAFLLVGLGDGHLFTFKLTAVATQGAATAAEVTAGGVSEGCAVLLGERRKVQLGSQPISLTSFESSAAEEDAASVPDAAPSVAVFAACERPTVVHSSNRKLLFSNVNLKDVTVMCPFSTQSFPGCLALATEQSLTIGTVDAIQKLHIRTVPLGEQPRRLSFQPETRSFLVCTVGDTPVDQPPPHVEENKSGDLQTSAGEAPEVGYLRLLDAVTLEAQDSFTLGPFEQAVSATSLSFADDDRAYFVVGTAYVLPTDPEPTAGRVLVFGVRGGPSTAPTAAAASKVQEGDDDDVDVTTAGGGDASEESEELLEEVRRLELVAMKDTRGAVYQVLPFNGKLLASVNSKVQLFTWSKKEEGSGALPDYELSTECGHHGHILALYLAVRGDFVLVGDLMKSMSLLSYSSEDGTLEEIARDYNTNWMTAVSMLSDEMFLGAENGCNLFTLAKNADAASDEERCRLDVVGEFHLGEFVNRFRHGSLVMLPSDVDPNTRAIPQLVYGTVSGAIGVVASLPKPLYDLLLRLQTAITTVVQGIGGLTHDTWRSFRNERKTAKSQGFIDGDLVETFLDLRRSHKEDVVRAMNQAPAIIPGSGSISAVAAAASSSSASAGAGQEEPVVLAARTVPEVVKIVEELTRLH